MLKKVSAAVYLVRLPGAIKGHFLNVDRLAPHVERTEAQFPQPSDQGNEELYFEHIF